MARLDSLVFFFRRHPIYYLFLTSSNDLGQLYPSKIKRRPTNINNHPESEHVEKKKRRTVQLDVLPDRLSLNVVVLVLADSDGLSVDRPLELRSDKLV